MARVNIMSQAAPAAIPHRPPSLPPHPPNKNKKTISSTSPVRLAATATTTTTAMATHRVARGGKGKQDRDQPSKPTTGRQLAQPSQDPGGVKGTAARYIDVQRQKRKEKWTRYHDKHNRKHIYMLSLSLFVEGGKWGAEGGGGKYEYYYFSVL